MNNQICLLKPDSVSTMELLPWLHKIDENCTYTNFGPLNAEFERALAKELNVIAERIATTANGTLALQLSLESLNLAENALVLIPSLTFVATAIAVIRAGYTPIIADVDLHSWLLTTDIAYSALQQYPIQAVVPVATFGVPQSTLVWDEFTEMTGVPVVIDAAGAFGNQEIGANTTVIFSLHATKTLSAGEGGVVVSPDADVIECIKNQSNFGIDRRQSGQVTVSGLNAKFSEYHAAVGLANLQQWRKNKDRRVELLKLYKQKLDDLGLTLQFQKQQQGCVFSIFNILMPLKTDVETLIDFLAERGIGSRRWYYPLIPAHPAFSNYIKVQSIQNAETLSAQLIGIPFHLRLTEKNIAYICESLYLFCHENIEEMIS